MLGQFLTQIKPSGQGRSILYIYCYRGAEWCLLLCRANQSSDDLKHYLHSVVSNK